MKTQRIKHEVVEPSSPALALLLLFLTDLPPILRISSSSLFCSYHYIHHSPHFLFFILLLNFFPFLFSYSSFFHLFLIMFFYSSFCSSHNSLFLSPFSPRVQLFIIHLLFSFLPFFSKSLIRLPLSLSLLVPLTQTLPTKPPHPSIPPSPPSPPRAPQRVVTRGGFGQSMFSLWSEWLPELKSECPIKKGK